MADIFDDSIDDTIEPSYREQIEKHRVALVQDIDLDRHFILTYLRSNNILDAEDCELIFNSGTTRQQRNSKFLDVLVSRGPNAFDMFIQALEFELPLLYELFTGRKPVQTPFGAIKSKETWADFDREYLSKELVKCSEQNSSLTHTHARLQKEKQLLEKQLLKVTSELNSSLKTQDELKFELSIKEINEAENYEQQTLNNLMNHCQALVQENADKSNIIIALQARLLAVNEDSEQMSKRNEELQQKNTNLMKQVKDLTINYDFQRTQSIKLQEKFNKSSNELTKSKEITRNLHTYKFNLLKMTEEKDELLRKLDEYRNVVTALNAKLSLITEQKEVETEKCSEISEEFMKIRQQARMYEIERDQIKKSTEIFKDKIARLNDELVLSREEKDFLTKQLERTANDRDRAISEQQEVVQYNNDLLKSRDEAVQQQIDLSEKMKKRYDAISLKLDTTNKELKDLMLESIRNTENTDAKMKCEIFQTELENAKKNLKMTKQERLHDIVENNDENLNTSGKVDAIRTQSVLCQAKAVLDGNGSYATDFSLNNRQLSWVYDSLKGKKSTFYTILNNPMVFPQFREEEEQAEKPEPNATEKRRIGSNRGMKPKRSNSALETMKAIISLPRSPTSNRRKSLSPL